MATMVGEPGRVALDEHRFYFVLFGICAGIAFLGFAPT